MSKIAPPTGISIDLRIVIPLEGHVTSTVLPQLERLIAQARVAGAQVSVRTDVDAMDHELTLLDNRIAAAELRAGTGPLGPEIAELRQRLDGAHAMSRFIRAVQARG